jgi:hypothetical protein
MPAENWDRVQEIFLGAADLAESDQAGFLDSACGGDRELLREVESLLQADRAGRTIISNAIKAEVISILME